MKYLVLFATTLVAIQIHAATFKTETVVKTDAIIWGFDFMPDGKILFTEREGNLKLFNPSTKKITTIQNTPQVVEQGQGGLLDVLLDRNFKKNSKIYLTYSAKVEGGQTTRLTSATLKDNKLTDIKELFTALPGTGAGQHFGSRVVQTADGMLYVTVGDRGERKSAQKKNIYHGKIFQVNPKGGYKLYTYGHRNPQGLALHPETKALWSVEHGPRGGDELNLIEKGKNYGWPVITYGKEYWGPSIGGTKKEGMEQPKYYYTPSIATSGLMIYSGKKFKDWKGQFFIGALKAEHISRVANTGSKFEEKQKLFKDNDERIRQIKESADGSIYYSTDNGKIIRVY